MPLTVTIIFEGDSSVGMPRHSYTMEMPFEQSEWDELTTDEKEDIKYKIKDIWDYMHADQLCKVILPGEDID